MSISNPKYDSWGTINLVHAGAVRRNPGLPHRDSRRFVRMCQAASDERVLFQRPAPTLTKPIDAKPLEAQRKEGHVSCGARGRNLLESTPSAALRVTPYREDLACISGEMAAASQPRLTSLPLSRTIGMLLDTASEVRSALPILCPQQSRRR